MAKENQKKTKGKSKEQKNADAMDAAASSHREKKYWGIASKEGVKWEFYPIFEFDQVEDRVECKWVEIRIDDKKVYTFHFTELWMFVYFCGNEEIRRTLEMRQERKISYVPYQVDFNLTNEEKERGKASRLIQLPLDEVNIYIAKQFAMDALHRLGPDGVKKMQYNKK